MENELNNFHIALRIAGMNLRERDLELIWSIFKMVQAEGEDLTIREIAALEAEMDEKHSEKYVPSEKI